LGIQPLQFLLQLLQLLLEVFIAEVFPRRHSHMAAGFGVPALGFDRIQRGCLALAGDVALSRRGKRALQKRYRLPFVR